MLGMLVSVGVGGLWRGRGVWGWVGLPVGILGLSFWADRDWGGGVEGLPFLYYIKLHIKYYSKIRTQFFKFNLSPQKK